MARGLLLLSNPFAVQVDRVNEKRIFRYTLQFLYGGADRTAAAVRPGYLCDAW